MRNFLTDFRYAWSSARRSPGVTLAIIAMLALGTGGVTAVFNPLYSTLFAPLPFPQSERLVIIGGDIPLYNIYFSRFEPAEELGRIFSSLTLYTPYPASRVAMPETGKNREVYAVEVDEHFFETLGIRPLRGSDFNQSEFRQGFIVSNRFWRNELMGSDDAVGKRIQVTPWNSGPLPIIGIMPESFDFPSGADIWMYDGVNTKYVIPARQYLGRLRPEISHGKAADELRAVDFKPLPLLHGNGGPLLQSLKTVLSGDRRPLLWMLGSAAVLFLLLVCAGVMNLLVTQGSRRKSEMALRLILGATRRNLVFQLLRETLPLVIAGALSGLWLSEIASAWLMARFPELSVGEVVVPVKMVFFAALVFAVTVIGGLTPALYASGVDLNTYLKSGSDARRRLFPFSLREFLTGIQLSLSLALLIGVGLLLSSLMFHVDVPIRWSSRDMFVVRADFPTELTFLSPAVVTAIPSKDAMTRYTLFYQELQHRLGAMPEVSAIGVFTPIPFSVDAVRTGQSLRSVSKTRPGEPERVSAQVFEGYANQEGFDMFGITLIAGRHFSSADIANELSFHMEPRDTHVGAVIVNQSLARQLWPGENAVGKIIYNGFRNAYEIIGVVRDFHNVGDRKEFVPAVYYTPDIWRSKQAFIVKLHSRSLIRDFRQRLAGFDASSASIEIRSLDDIVSGATANMRLTLQLLGIFAVFGIIVSGLGVYATTSLMAASWNREMGIRIAVGAQSWDILSLALWRGTRAIVLGLPFGLFLAWILSRTLSSFLFQVNVDDSLAWVTSCAILLVITIVAAFIPALRVTRVNPMDVLRD